MLCKTIYYIFLIKHRESPCAVGFILLRSLTAVDDTQKRFTGNHEFSRARMVEHMRSIDTRFR